MAISSSKKSAAFKKNGSSSAGGGAARRKSNANANAAGYAKRQSQKKNHRDTAEGHDVGDVYEYQAMKTRRGNVALDFDREEMDGHGRGRGGDAEDDDEDEDGTQTHRRPRLVGELNEDGIGSDEDEDIDSDEAFEESDEERFAGFSFGPKKKVRIIFVCYRVGVLISYCYSTGCSDAG